MSMEEDGELLQDFLIDAGEILEQLTQQAVELEKSPGDKEIINAVFRGFHTIKGGASFLALEPLVALCHRTEDVFNVLRNGERAVDAEVMDVVLPVLDVLKEQFIQLAAGLPPREADLWILDKLDELASPEGRKKSRSSKPIAAKRNTQISNKKKKRNHVLSAGTDNQDNLKESVSVFPIAQDKQPDLDMEEITDDEFDALLDQFQNLRQGVVYGQRHGGASQSDNPGETGASPELPDDNDENISEEEFDALLDAIHRSSNKINLNSPLGSGALYGADDNTPVKPGRQGDAKVVPDANLATDASPVNSKPATPVSNSKSRETVQAETTVRVDTKRLDDIMNLVGELVLVRNRMTSLEGLLQNEEVSKVVSNLDIVTADLQTAVMKTRMQPIKKVFGRFPRVVRDLARSLKKEVSLELQGEDTDLDKNLVEALADPLVHLVRNAVDHGIEPPDERVANGKPRKGTVILTAEQEGDHILLTIEDDGKGMDADRIRKTAVQKGLMDEEAAARLDDKECYALTFQPGFSTKEEISNVSGRGVGMDVVKTRIEQLNGSVSVDSRKGHGSKIIIKVPLTLAIMPTLMVMVAKQIFALPLASVNEIFHLDLTKTNVVDGQLVVMVRKKALPLFYLRHWLIKGAAGTDLPEAGHVVVVSMGVQRIGFVVDQLIGQEEVVIKPLGAILHGMKGLAGATITGDGRISLILDIPGLMQTYAQRH
ncbi:MAG: chemotaxis protein CheA [Gammaproteobacteria bacterium]|nr:chemotaxis protein CheA [Gammaproteobacteria bacterium]